MSDYKTTIGLEVHIELKTKTKMFCGCKNNPHESTPNKHVCPICMGHPGTLPVANQTAISHVITFGHAVAGVVADYSEFDRKNYFYPDIPKAYQLSQYAFPFVKGGELAGVQITRVHLEEDTARSQHDKGDYSLVDYNRAGVPLMELVTEPVIHDAKTAGQFAKELQLLLRTLKISDANMEKGEMRIEANISVSKTAELGTKVEVKNLNSFKSVELAIEHETRRQISVQERGEQLTQETRGWDENKLQTYAQRSKETAKDYRYFPDPDLPKLQIATIATFQPSRIAEMIPLLPEEKRLKYRDIGISSESIESLLHNEVLDAYAQQLIAIGTDDTAIIVTAVHYLLSDIWPLIGQQESATIVLDPKELLVLMELVFSKKITSRVAKDLLAEYITTKEPGFITIITDRKLLKVSDTNAVDELVKTVLANNETAVNEYKAGKETAIKYLVGQGMKLSKGSADPQVLEERLVYTIAETR